jgi:hypothetical protein
MAKGGKRPGSGRKSKAEEHKLADRLSPLDDSAFAAIEQGINNADFHYIKMFMEYRFGKPNEKVDITSKGESINPVQIFKLPDNGRT